MPKKKATIFGSVVLIIAGGYFVLAYIMQASVHHLPPENYTSTSMYPLKTRILRFVNNNDRLPHSLQELPELEGFTNRTKDYWGNEIMMKTEWSKVILVSYGKDMMKGGINDNLDVIGAIETRTIEGGWVNEDANWLSKPIENKGVY